MDSVAVRSSLVDALRLDLIGPEPGLGALDESLVQAPSRWYLTGFLVPRDAGEEQKTDEGSEEEVAAEAPETGIEDGAAPEPAAAKKKYLPSSMGMSLLAPNEVGALKILARWGDYAHQDHPEGNPGGAPIWQRTHHEETITVDIPNERMAAREKDVPNSGGLKIACSVRPVNVSGNLAKLIPAGTKVVSVFLVNRRRPAADRRKDEAFAFQTQLETHASRPFVARPNLRSFESDDWDERVADLQYRDAYEYAVGHATSTEAILTDGGCREVRTAWIPQAEVLRVAPSPMADSVTLSMDELAALSDGKHAKAKLGNFVTEYAKWITQQTADAPQEPERRKDTGNFLLQRADFASKRIEQGIEVLGDPLCLEAFRIANRVMAQQARQRRGVWEKKDPATITPTWYPFQLAFILMNLGGIIDPKHADRMTVDLLFFPTGGGKTEAYLGLSAFTLALRRLKNPGIASAGLTVLMRYTLRLLTLDQLSRAATMICALEMERQKDVTCPRVWYQYLC